MLSSRLSSVLKELTWRPETRCPHLLCSTWGPHFFHSSQQDLVRTAVLPSIRQWFRQCIDKPAKKISSGMAASYSSGGMQQIDKAKIPWQNELTSSRHLKQNGWTGQRYLLILNSCFNQQALSATKGRVRMLFCSKYWGGRSIHAT